MYLLIEKIIWLSSILCGLTLMAKITLKAMPTQNGRGSIILTLFL
jgi:hypothetical protein